MKSLANLILLFAHNFFVKLLETLTSEYKFQHFPSLFGTWAKWTAGWYTSCHLVHECQNEGQFLFDLSIIFSWILKLNLFNEIKFSNCTAPSFFWRDQKNFHKLKDRDFFHIRKYYLTSQMPVKSPFKVLSRSKFFRFTKTLNLIWKFK